MCISDNIESCSCTDTPTNFSSVTNSTQLIFNFPDLQAYTLYCMQSIGIYRVIQRLKATPEVTRGESISIMTDGKEHLVAHFLCKLKKYVEFLYVVGVPDPPFIRITGNMLQWDEPNARGSAITLYRVLLM